MYITVRDFGYYLLDNHVESVNWYNSEVVNWDHPCNWEWQWLRGGNIEQIMRVKYQSYDYTKACVDESCGNTKTSAKLPSHPSKESCKQKIFVVYLSPEASRCINGNAITSQQQLSNNKTQKQKVKVSLKLENKKTQSIAQSIVNNGKWQLSIISGYLFDASVKKKDHSITNQRQASKYGEVDSARSVKLNTIKV